MNHANKMNNKSFTIKPKSNAKRDKALLDLEKLETLLSEITERQKMLQSQKTRVTEKIRNTKKTIANNT